MKNIKVLESNYPIRNGSYNAFQFKLPLDFFTEVPVNDSVASFKKKVYHSMNFKTNEKSQKICPQGHLFNIFLKENHSTRGTYLQITQDYACDQCKRCPVKEKCTSSGKGRTYRRNPILEEMQKKVDENLSTEKGKEMKK